VGLRSRVLSAVNLAVGGGLGGPVRADTAFPARYLIDYIRVYHAD
jgi:hypothetical protein